jgi:hypothetical protein
VIVADPGAGKSTWVHAAILHLLDERSQPVIPIFAELRNYKGNLRSLLEHAPIFPNSKRKVPEGPSSGRYIYVLDGIDEVADEYIDSFLEELNGILSDLALRVILTCRQGFYAHVSERIPPGIVAFGLLPFSAEDISTFVEHEKLRPEDFFTALESADFGLEASNPFTLGTLVSSLKLQGKLESLRSLNLRTVVDALLKDQRQKRPLEARRALRLMAVAMEVYGRNVLTRDECLRVLREGIQTSATEAGRLLEELSRYILLATPSGYAFQMRSYGEFLAAEELVSARLDRILEFAFFSGTRRPNPTWKNTVSYLVEMHTDVRRYFATHLPEWVLNSSPPAFDDNERADVLEAVLKNLADTDAFLVGHQTVAHHKLARFCQQHDVAQPRAMLGSSQSSVIGNALVLLGHLKDAAGLKAATATALDRTKTSGLRHSAITALVAGADPALIPTISASLDPTDPLFDHLLDCIGGVMTPRDIGQVLPLFGRTRTMLSTVFYRFASFRSADALEATLDFLIKNPTSIRDDHISSYVEFPLRLAARLWNDSVANRIAALLLAWEDAGIDDSMIRCLPSLADTVLTKDKEGFVARRVLEDSIRKNHVPEHMIHTVARICNVPVARWLVTQAEGIHLAEALAFRADGDVRQVLGSVLGGVIAVQDDYRERYERENRERTAQRERKLDAAREVIRTSQSLDELASAFHTIPVRNWPEIERTRLAWIEGSISTWIRGRLFGSCEVGRLADVPDNGRFRQIQSVPSGRRTLQGSSA